MKALNQPESWWGWHGYNHPEALSIIQILKAGTMPPRVAAILSLAMERGASMIFAADPPGAGKTTILTSLLAFAPPEASVYFTRGWGETFRLPPIADGDPPVWILINEISDHLPVYSWGPYVQKAFELMRDGYSVASTMHAETVEGVIEQLTDECDVPAHDVGYLSFAVPMFIGSRDGRRIRRVSEVAVLEPLGAGYDRHTIAKWNPESDTYEVLATPAQVNAAARRLDLEDEELIEKLALREQFLETLIEENVTAIDEVQRRAFQHAGYEVVDDTDDDGPAGVVTDIPARRGIIMANSYDVIIVGGGIGGGSLATVLARRGKSVLVLEKSTVYRDKVRGEWIAPWGVVELKQMGLYDDIIAAGAHHVSRHVSYGDGIDPAQAEAGALPLGALVPDIPGPLCFGHPASCDLWNATAIAAGATILRDVSETTIACGAAPTVTYTQGGTTTTARCKIIVGADGRGSTIRKQAGIEEHRDPNHHLFSGMLIEGADGWPDDLQALGAEGDVHYLVFPQGKGRARLYLGYASDQAQRLTGEGAQQRFLEAFRLKSMPGSEHIANAKAVGPCHSYPNEDTWVDEPYSLGVVLIGDAAGHNDPIIGQGLSITYRDVRMVSDVLLAGDDWSPAAFAAYGEERKERMRRLRFAAALQSMVENEFGPEAEERRQRAYKNRAADPTLMLPALATMMGPDKMPPMAFEPEIIEKTFA